MSSCRILVVDDEADTCRNLSDILTDLGHEVTMAFDGRQALQLVRELPFDIALLDFKMPGMDGLALYREIKQLRPEIVAIIVTAYATRETTESALSAGAWQVLAKPIDLQHLLSLVENAAALPLVMLVDDDAALCSSLWDVLHERGFRVSLAHDERQASQALGDGDQRVVIIDMQLPQGDGLSVFRSVRQSNPEARVILITGHRSELQSVIDCALAEGADTVCYKPFDIPQLIQTIERLSSS